MSEAKQHGVLEMRFCGFESVIIALLVGLILIQGGYGESISTGGGTSVAVGKGSSVEGSLDANDLGMQSSASSTGVISNLKSHFWARNLNGDFAKVGVEGTNVADFSSYYQFYPGKGPNWNSDRVSAEQWLSASWADSLYMNSIASNLAGEQAYAIFDLTSGSLDGYYSAAYAGPASWLGMSRVTAVQQTAEYSDGEHILVQTWAENAPNDKAESKTELIDGTLDGYSATAMAAKYPNGLRAAGVSAELVSASAPYGSIYQLMWARDFWGDTSQVSTYINRGSLNSYPYIPNSVSNAYAISDWHWVDAFQSVDASSAGPDNYLYSNGESYNKIYGTDSYKQVYSDGQVRFWNSAVTRPKLAGQWHGLLS
jgi:hypothetical protein